MKQENETLEYKKTTSELKEAIISITSMLNKSGEACVYFGIKNNGEIVGVDIGAATLRNIEHKIRQSICPAIVPTIKTITKKNKDVIKIVAKGEDTPYSAFHKYYIRINDSDTYMPNNVLESYFRNKEFDYSKWETADSGHTIEDADENLLIAYINEANDCGRINFLYKDAYTSLNKLHLLSNDNPENLNNSGYYLFSNNKPLLLKLATYPSDDRIKFSDIKQFRGNIFECINESIKYISNNIKWSAQIVGTKRVEQPEIPMEAIREIVVNSFAHMKINGPSSNEITISPSCVQIYNPGTMIQGTTPSTFANHEQGSMIRNPLIAQVLYYNGSIDAFGTGFSRVYNLCKDNIELEYNNGPYGFTFRFIRNPKTSNLNYHNKQTENNDITRDRINDRINYDITLTTTVENYLFTNSEVRKISNTAVNIYSIIAQDNYISTKELSDRLNKSIATINRGIKELKDSELISREGSKKSGHWKLL